MTVLTNMLSKTKKITLGMALVLFAFTSLAGSVLLVRPAKAQITIVGDLPAQAKTIASQIFEGIKTAVINGAIRITAYAMRKIAYDSAVWLASGGKGQSAFAHTKSFGDYMQNIGDDAAGLAIEELGKPFGLNLCKIPDLKTDVALRVGLRTNFLKPQVAAPARKPKCNFTTFKENWLDADAWKSKFGSETLAKRFNAAISVDQSDLGIALSAVQQISKKSREATTGAALERQEGEGIRSKKRLLSDEIIIPAKLQAEGFKAVTPDKQQAKDEDQLQALLAAGDIKVLPTALSIFLNTLVGTMVKNFQQQGVLPFGICVGNFGGEHCKRTGAGVASRYDSAGLLGGRRAAEELFSGFLVVEIDEKDNYDILGQLSNCPETQGTYNCRADSGLVQAAQQFESGTPLTINAALEQGLLHGEWRLLPPQRVSENRDKNCHKDAYCYANIKVLRQARILPLGFEIAARKSNPDTPWTLQQVVAGFNECTFDASGRVIE